MISPFAWKTYAFCILYCLDKKKLNVFFILLPLKMLASGCHRADFNSV